MHCQLERRPLAQHLADALELLSLGREHHVAARLERDGLQLLPAASEQRAERPEGCRRHLGDHGDERLPDDVAIAELGVIDVAAHRQRDVDASVGVTQDGDGEVQR